MKGSTGIPLIALVHVLASYARFAVSFGIGMKSLDGPHLLTSSEKIWTWIARIMSLPLTEPLQHLTKDLLAPVVTGPSHAGVRDLAAVIWFFGPVVLNSLLWAAVIWWASARIKRRFGRVLPGE